MLQVTFDWNWMISIGVIILLCNAAYFIIDYIKKEKGKLTVFFGGGESIELPRREEATARTDLGKRLRQHRDQFY